MCLYELHEGPIRSISISAGFAITGSDDCFLRVWPLEFDDYYMQARHQGSVVALDVSKNGLR